MSEARADFAALGALLRRSTVRVHDGTRGSGSGVVWNRGGLVLTNAHVAQSRRARVEFEDGRCVAGEVVLRDERRDLAAVRIPAGDALHPVDVRASQTLVPGELVVAVGNPFGLVGALSAGIVQRRNPRWVVTGVRLKPGNSGGPLADGTGRVVGINSLVYGDLGFAVPTEAIDAFLAIRP